VAAEGETVAVSVMLVPVVVEELEETSVVAVGVELLEVALLAELQPLVSIAASANIQRAVAPRTERPFISHYLVELEIS